MENSIEVIHASTFDRKIYELVRPTIDPKLSTNHPRTQRVRFQPINHEIPREKKRRRRRRRGGRGRGRERKKRKNEDKLVCPSNDSSLSRQAYVPLALFSYHPWMTTKTPGKGWLRQSHRISLTTALAAFRTRQKFLNGTSSANATRSPSPGDIHLPWQSLFAFPFLPLSLSRCWLLGDSSRFAFIIGRLIYAKTLRDRDSAVNFRPAVCSSEISPAMAVEFYSGQAEQANGSEGISKRWKRGGTTLMICAERDARSRYIESAVNAGRRDYRSRGLSFAPLCRS